MDTTLVGAFVTASFALITSLGGIYLTHRLRQGVKEEKVQSEKQQDDIDDIAFIVTKILSEHEFFFLSELGDRSDYQFKDNHRDKVHLRRLRDLKMINTTSELENISDLKKKDVLREKFIILPAGETYLKIRNRVIKRGSNI